MTHLKIDTYHRYLTPPSLFHLLLPLPLQLLPEPRIVLPPLPLVYPARRLPAEDTFRLFPA